MEEFYSIQKLKTDIEQLYNENKPIPTLIMVFLGIEYVGAYFDKEPFEKAGLSEKRFNKALKELFPKEFYIKRNYYYRTLRAELIHGINTKNFLYSDYKQITDAFLSALNTFLEEKEKLNIPLFKLKKLDF
jgi:hypothetical protein